MKFKEIISDYWKEMSLLKKGVPGVCLLLLTGAGFLFYFSLPTPLFNSSYSTVLEDRNGILIGAKIADDEQWRFPISDEVPRKFKTAIIEFEDRNFESHFGVDPLAIARAIKQNYNAGEVVSGASTLSMQVIRLAKGNPDRTVLEKLKEMIQATRLEIVFSKDEILALYSAHAPFGGNVVGLEAASWRYFGRKSDQLSWAETATLAVLPNSPALIHPGRNRDALKAKRDRLLKRLLESKKIDSLTYDLSVLEPLPQKPLALPNEAPHLVSKFYSGDLRGKKTQTSLDLDLQKKVNRVIDRNHEKLKANGIQNASVLVLDVKSQEVISYVGNTKGYSRQHGQSVDVITAPRSSGSILKPLLYLMKMNEGEMLPNTLVPDVPSKFSDYSPQNYNRSYDGAVPASEALSRSLNVPAVYMLQEFGVPKFHHYLKELGLSTVTNDPEHYGLSLILGGAEITLWDITSVYGSLAHQLSNYDPSSEVKNNYELVSFSAKTKVNQLESKASAESVISEAAIFSTFEAMLEVSRPDEEANWRRFQNARKVAWKTGTSYGYRDGWAIGITPEFVVGVWVGNADGEGRPELTGLKAAGPILFDVFDVLPQSGWFNEPIYEMEEILVCELSGHRAGSYCPVAKPESVPKTGLETKVCPYHQLVYVNSSETQRMNSSCADLSELKAKNWFVLPPVQEWYYKRAYSDYKDLPPLASNCGEEDQLTMRLIYPFNSSIIYVPKEIDGSMGKTVFEIAHRDQQTKIFWHLDETFLGETETFHQLALSPKPGKHTLVLVDEKGERLEHEFEVLAK
ncbi:MAG: penicillin-binding protein 1C [Balneola sp.]